MEQIKYNFLIKQAEKIASIENRLQKAQSENEKERLFNTLESITERLSLEDMLFIDDYIISHSLTKKNFSWQIKVFMI